MKTLDKLNFSKFFFEKISKDPSSANRVPSYENNFFLFFAMALLVNKLLNLSLLSWVSLLNYLPKVSGNIMAKAPPVKARAP